MGLTATNASDVAAYHTINKEQRSEIEVTEAAP